MAIIVLLEPLLLILVRCKKDFVLAQLLVKLGGQESAAFDTVSDGQGAGV